MDNGRKLNLLFLIASLTSVVGNIKDVVDPDNELDINDIDDKQEIAISGRDIKDLIKYWESLRKSLYKIKTLDLNNFSTKEFSEYWIKRNLSDDPSKAI